MPKIIEGKSAIKTFFRDRAENQVATRLSEREDSIVLEKRAPGIVTVTAADDAQIPDADTIKSLCEKAGVKFVEKVSPLDGDEPTMQATADRTKLIWASDERVDRDGDIVRQDWRFENFDKNPLVLFGHEWHMPPIGAVLQHEIVQRNDVDFQGPALRLLETFADKEVWDWADVVFRLLDSGFMRSGSVGFFPGRIVIPEDDTERTEMGLGRWGAVLEHNELIEHSHVSVPANPGAHEVLAGMKSKGLLKAADLQVIRELKRRDSVVHMADPALWKSVDSGLCQLWKHLFPKIEIDTHEDIECSIDPNGVKDPDCCGDSKSRTKIGMPPGVRESLYKDRHDRLRLADKVWIDEDYEKADPVDGDSVTKPFIGEHACRLHDPADFIDDSFRRTSTTNDDGKRVDIILAIREVDEGEDPGDPIAQSIRYPVDDWTEDEARETCTDNDGILFEPALPDPDAEEESIDPPAETDELTLAHIAIDLEQFHTRQTSMGDGINEIKQTLRDLVERLEEGDRLASVPDEPEAVGPVLPEILAIDPKALDKAREAAQAL